MKYVKPFLYQQSKEAAFQDALKAEIDGYFRARGGNKKATPLMWFKVLLFVGAYWGFWASVALVPHSVPVTIALLMGLSISTIILAFNVSHDAVHGALTGKPRWDDLIFYLTFSFLGPNAYLWRIRHNNAHHYFVNIPGSDMDIEGTKLLRVAPHIPWRAVHRYQHWYCSFFYAIFTLHWIFFKDFKIFFMKTFGGVTDLRHSPWRFVELLAWKVVYLAYAWGIPLLYLPYSFAQILAFFIGFHLVTSYLLLVIFAISHIAMESHYVIQGEKGHIPHSFLEHQLLTSVDFNPLSHVLGFFFGGFNCHVAHHMFPTICSIHYLPLTRVIQRVTREHGLKYFEMSMPRLVRSHYRLMKKLGQSPRAGTELIID